MTFELIEHRLMLAAEVSGIAWNDLNGDGLWQSAEPALPGWELYLDLNDNRLRDPEVQRFRSSGAPLPIRDRNTIHSTLSVSGFGSPLTDVNLSLTVDHTYLADLDIFLISPAGTRVELLTDVGGPGDNFSGTMLDDQAPTSIISGSPPFAASFRPEQPLSILNGEDANGVWTLELTDDAHRDVGNLLDWALFLTGVGEPTAISDTAGDFVFPGLSAGNYTLRQLVPAGWEPTVPAGGERTVNITDDDHLVGVNFGNRSQTGEIRGRVWNDFSGDGGPQAGEAGLPGRSVYLDLNANGQLDRQIRTIDSPDTPLAFADLTAISSQINVSGFATPITEVKVTLFIEHTWTADLDAFLISPAGTRVELFSDVGGGGHDFSGTVLDDRSARSITSAAAPFADRFRPEQPLSGFVGEDANGVWTLEITDDFRADTGELLGWRLHLGNESEPRVFTDTHGDFAFTGLRPGSYAVRQVVPDEWTQTYPLDNVAHQVSLASGQLLGSIDFGSQPPHSQQAAIRGTVWADGNRDGLRQSGERGLENSLVFLDLNGNGEYDPGNVSVSYPGPLQPIVDLQTLTSQLTVSGATAPILDVNVTLDIDHTYAADLDAFLISPTGTRVELFSDVGGASDNFRGTTLDDQAATPAEDGAAPFSGSFRPEGQLSAYNGEDANGIWTLEIADDADRDTGHLREWSLILVTQGEPFRDTDANGGYSFDHLARGAYSVRQIPNTGWSQTFPTSLEGLNVTIRAGQTLHQVDFGNANGLTEIHGVAWNDLDGDGVQDGGEHGLSGRRVFIDENENGVLDEHRTWVSANDLHQPLADLATSLATLEVAEFVGPISDVNVTLHIEHTWDADLDVFLIGPMGTRVELFTDVGASGDNFFDTTFDDQASRSVTDVVAPFISSMRPEGRLADFNGRDANGTWILEITDDAAQDSGELIAWSLTIEGRREPRSLSDANGVYSFTDLPPGTYTVAQQLPAHWEQTSPPNGAWTFDMSSGTIVQDAHFGSRNSHPSLQLLPDFTVLADRDEEYLYGWSIDTTSQPGTTLLRLSTAVANIGEGPVEIVGHDVNAEGRQNVLQRIYDTDGNFTERLAGSFINHSGHGHVHFDDYAAYFLRAVTAQGGVGDVVASGEKVSFCLLDSVAHGSGLTTPPTTSQYVGCGDVQGISVGWADLYGLHLPDQWIDITGVPAGQYWLEVVVDPENRLTELDETNNVSRILIELDTTRHTAPK